MQQGSQALRENLDEGNGKEEKIQGGETNES